MHGVLELEVAQSLELNAFDVHGVVSLSMTCRQSIEIKGLHQTKLHIEVVAALFIVVLEDGDLEKLEELGVI